MNSQKKKNHKEKLTQKEFNLKITGKYLNKVLEINAKHALYREIGDWYHHLKKFPGVLFDRNGYLIFQTKQEYNSHPSLKHKKELHIKGGIELIKEYKLYPQKQKRLITGVFDQKEKQVNIEDKVRLQREISIILRNQSLVKKIKRLYNDSCQICGLQLGKENGITYSEVHHIKPLGNPHNGKDTIDNMICVCPNHHALLDLKLMRINKNAFSHLKHNLSLDNIKYHNSILKESI